MSETTAKAGFSTAPRTVIEGESKRYFTFFNVILALIAMTFIELIMIILPFNEHVLLGALIVLSASKFGLVIWYFMHLRWDKIVLSALFLLGLFLATGTGIALCLLFPAGESAMVGQPPAALESPGH